MSDHDHSCRGGGGGEGGGPNLSCREISDFILAYLERELDPAVRDEFETHVHYCPPCGHYVDGYKDTIELIRACTKPPTEEQKRKYRPPEGLIQAILSARRHAKSSEPSGD